MTVLKDLWYGNINPHETFLNGNCRFKHLLSLMGKNRDNLSDTLTEQQKELLEKYDEAVNEMHSLAEQTAFQLYSSFDDKELQGSNPPELHRSKSE